MAENSPFWAYKAFEIRAAACRTKQETRREQFYNEDISGAEGDGHEADSEIVPNKKLAQGKTNREGDFAVFRQQMMEVNVGQPPDLPNMQTKVQQSIIPKISPPFPGARGSGFLKLSKATITADDTHTSVPENITIEHVYEQLHHHLSLDQPRASHPTIMHLSLSKKLWIGPLGLQPEKTRCLRPLTCKAFP